MNRFALLVIVITRHVVQVRTALLGKYSFEFNHDFTTSRHSICSGTAQHTQPTHVDSQNQARQKEGGDLSRCFVTLRADEQIRDKD